jgi:hypothetical protein
VKPLKVRKTLEAAAWTWHCSTTPAI